MRSTFGLLIPLVLFSSCQRATQTQATTGGTKVVSIMVKSTAFKEGESIPSKYTCDGDSVSPPIEWAPGPDSTKSYALITDDPDAPSGTFVHWVLFILPSTVHALPERVPAVPKLQNGAIQGTNSAGKVGYLGPCPPSGTHHYRFKVYALDTTLSLTSSAKAKDLVNAMQGHVVGQGMLTGTYKRK